jgi:hypothetical protein
MSALGPLTNSFLKGVHVQSSNLLSLARLATQARLPPLHFSRPVTMFGHLVRKKDERSERLKAQGTQVKVGDLFVIGEVAGTPASMSQIFACREAERLAVRKHWISERVFGWSGCGSRAPSSYFLRSCCHIPKALGCEVTYPPRTR